MQMTDVDYNRLLVRVTKLERQNRFWKITGLMMLLAAAFSQPGVELKGCNIFSYQTDAWPSHRQCL